MSEDIWIGVLIHNDMLINISNHPLASWSREQRQAANSLYGEIVDLPFPNVNPMCSELEIDCVANDLCDRIKEISPDASAAVAHVMGEMTLTFSLVVKLQKLGYKCVASCTERDVVMNPDGTKTARFSFAQFRPYDNRIL